MKMGDGASEACKREMLRKVALMTAMWLTIFSVFGLFFWRVFDNPFYLVLHLALGILLTVATYLSILKTSVSKLQYDDEKISYSLRSGREGVTHPWSEVEVARIKSNAIIFRFSDGKSVTLPGVDEPIGKDIASTYLRNAGETDEVMFDDLAQKISGYFVIAVLLYLISCLLLLSFFSGRLALPLLIPVFSGLLTMGGIYAVIQEFLITRIVIDSEGIRYSHHLRQNEKSRHIWSEVTKARIGPRLIYFRFSNGDRILTSGTKTDIGRKVAEAYESYSSGDSEA